MSVITMHDIIECVSNTLMYCDDIPPPVSVTPISESELMCGERIVPEYPNAEPVFPTMVHVHSRLLAFDTMDTTPLCLKPPTKGCCKRFRDEVEGPVAYACNESMTSFTKAPRRDNEWLSWVNWDQAA